MRPEARFLMQPKSFWAYVRSVSEVVGYSAGGWIFAPSFEQIVGALDVLGLSSDEVSEDGVPTAKGQMLLDYFEHRAGVLNDQAPSLLMDADDAAVEFWVMYEQLDPSCPLPMNKQKGEKRTHAFLTGMVNMQIEAHAGEYGCDYDPRRLTTVTRNGYPIRTFARRVDGAFPAAVNPIAVWEIKEYYYTTTFGSRVAGGVYESLLDGLEIEELREHEGIDVKHYLMVDGRYTWWHSGKSYLCRLVDLLHMGYADEVLFGREVITEMPRLVAEWIASAEQAG